MIPHKRNRHHSPLTMECIRPIVCEKVRLLLLLAVSMCGKLSAAPMDCYQGACDNDGDFLTEAISISGSSSKAYFFISKFCETDPFKPRCEEVGLDKDGIKALGCVEVSTLGFVCDVERDSGDCADEISTDNVEDDQAERKALQHIFPSIMVRGYKLYHYEACDGLDNDCDPDTLPESLEGNIWAESDNDFDYYLSCSQEDLIVEYGERFEYEYTTAENLYTNDGQYQCEAISGQSDATCHKLDGNADCNDNDISTYAGAIEKCDGKDNNCDGLISGELDNDNDGSYKCSALNDPNQDCKDDDNTVKPGAVETCDGKDTNCDKQYLGYNNELSSLASVESDGDNDGQSECLGDCDDGDPAVFDGAKEVCDGHDSDCNGDIPSEETVDSDKDSYPSCNDCNDDINSIHPNAKEACDGADTDCSCTGQFDEESCIQEEIRTEELDIDGDGITQCSGDCDDNDSEVYPTASETCNGKDDDCNLKVDDNLPLRTYYYDSDDDSYGITNVAENMCYSTPPEYWSDKKGDCDDSNAFVYPGAYERCDGIDNDCNSVIPDVEEDNDKDGFRPCSDCDDGKCGDCNDALDSIYPGAEEQCDGVDNDCSSTDGNTPESWEADIDGDGYVEGKDGLECTSSIVDGDCNDQDKTINPGAQELCNEVDDNCDGIIDSIDPVVPEGNDTSDPTCPGVGPDQFTLYVIDQDLDGFPDEFATAEERRCFCGCPAASDPTNTLWDETTPTETKTCVDTNYDGYVDDDIGNGVYVSYLDSTGITDFDCNDDDNTVHPDRGEESNELLDGTDTNCDDQLPLVEIDCDSDGQYPLPQLKNDFDPSGSTETASTVLSCSADVAERVQLIDPPTFGLKSCTDYFKVNDDAGNRKVEVPLTVCGVSVTFNYGNCRLKMTEDKTTFQSAFWFLSKSRLAELRKSFPVPIGPCPGASNFADCDDLVATTCGCTKELCDGKDTNCGDGNSNFSSVQTDTFGDPSGDAGAGDGIPDAMQTDRFARSGFVPREELDLDADGALRCHENEKLSENASIEYACNTEGCTPNWSSDRYADIPSSAWVFGDKEQAISPLTDGDRCALAKPSQNTDDPCDGIYNNQFQAEYSDENGEKSGERATCGPNNEPNWSGIPEYIYVLAYDRDYDAPIGDITSATGMSEPRFIPLTLLRSTLPDACVEGDTLSDPSTAALMALLEDAEAQQRAPTQEPLLPRASDGELNDYLRLVRLCLPDATNVMTQDGPIASSAEPSPTPVPSESTEPESTVAGPCRVLRIELNGHNQADIQSFYADFLNARHEHYCAEAYTSTALWSADRIRSARRVLSLWDCIRSGQCMCFDDSGNETSSCTNALADVSDNDYAQRAPYPNPDDVPVGIDSDQLLEELNDNGDSLADGESMLPEIIGIDLYPFLGLEPAREMPGWVSQCWGDPLAESYSGGAVGGGCESDGNRDLPEGPEDRQGYIIGAPNTCEACFDNIDNNCDGVKDGDDPSCLSCLDDTAMSCGCRDKAPDDELPASPSMLLVGAPIAWWLRRRARGGRS